jgi:RNA polymerase sigma-70 factor (ECF subfamily)
MEAMQPAAHPRLRARSSTNTGAGLADASLGVPSSDLQNACEEVFLVVHRRIPEFDGRSSLIAWIYRICVRIAADRRRGAHQRREQVTVDPPELPVPPTGPNAIDDARTLERLLAILDGIKQSKREIFVLAAGRAVDDEIAGRSIACFAPRRARSRARQPRAPAA